MPIRFKGSTRHRAHRGTDFVAVFTLRDDRKAFACRCAELTNDRHTKPPPQFVERVSAYFIERKWFAGKLIDHTCTSARRPKTLVSGSNLLKNTVIENESEHINFASNEYQCHCIGGHHVPQVNSSKGASRLPALNVADELK